VKFSKAEPIVLNVAVAGTTMPAIALFPIVTTTVQPTATTTLASAFVVFSKNKNLLCKHSK